MPESDRQREFKVFLEDLLNWMKKRQQILYCKLKVDGIGKTTKRITSENEERLARNINIRRQLEWGEIIKIQER